MRKTLLCCLLALALMLPASSLLAVDGYKSLKFGMSLEEVKKTKICGWVDNGAVEIKHIHIIYCLDFKFNGEPIAAAAYFIDNKFLKLVINIPYSDRNSTLAGLNKKYGSLSRIPSQQSIDNFNSLPNQELWYGFDGDTIYLLCRSNKFYKKSAALIYTSPLYDKLLTEKQVNSLKDDL